MNKVTQTASAVLKDVPGVLSLVLIGSQARGNPSPNSDYDYSMLVNAEFDLRAAAGSLAEAFGESARYALASAIRNKLSVYLGSGERIEINCFTELEGLDRYFLGSEIPLEQVPGCVAFDHTGVVLPHLLAVSELREQRNAANVGHPVDLMHRFMYEFENASSCHRRSDSYKFYFFYNIALHIAIQLKCLAEGQLPHAYLPKNFFEKNYRTRSRQEYLALAPGFRLEEANFAKRKLLDFFFSSLDAVQTILDAEKAETRSFLEWVFERDFFWNVRDAAKFNPKLKSGILHRSSTLTLFQQSPKTAQLLRQMGVTDIVDLRHADELQESPYSPETLSGVRYHHLPIDPRNQSGAFRERWHYGTDHQIAYRHFADGHRREVAAFFQAVLQAEGAVLVHCFAGKDRTGSLVTLAHLLSGADRAAVERDYLASESDTALEKLDAFLEVVEADGGLFQYLYNCGLTEGELRKITDKITAGNTFQANQHLPSAF